MSATPEKAVNVYQELAINHLKSRFQEGFDGVVDFFLGLADVTDIHRTSHVTEECFPCAQRAACERALLDAVWSQRQSIVDIVQTTPDFSHRRHQSFAKGRSQRGPRAENDSRIETA